MNKRIKLPIDNSKIINLWRYSFKDVKSYDELTVGEQLIITEQDFCIIKGLI